MSHDGYTTLNARMALSCSHPCLLSHIHWERMVPDRKQYPYSPWLISHAQLLKKHCWRHLSGLPCLLHFKLENWKLKT